MRLSDASGDGQAEADTVVIGAYAFGPALERLGERLNELGLSSAPVFLHWIHAAPRRARLALFADLLVITSLVVVLGGQVLAGSTTTTSSEDAQVSANASHESPHGDPPGSPTQNGELDVADGEIPENVTVFDGQCPAVANLDQDLSDALSTASTDASRDGVEVYVNSGWRSVAYQEQLLDEAISTYGSRSAAARWVATPDTSPHVSGDAVDLGGSDALTWLSAHGAEYGLCQIYGNEPWHYELRPGALDHGCPGMYADPTQDPRMQ